MFSRFMALYSEDRDEEEEETHPRSAYLKKPRCGYEM
jgi:hypothetical protein